MMEAALGVLIVIAITVAIMFTIYDASKKGDGSSKSSNQNPYNLIPFHEDQEEIGRFITVATMIIFKSRRKGEIEAGFERIIAQASLFYKDRKSQELMKKICGTILETYKSKVSQLPKKAVSDMHTFCLKELEKSGESDDNEIMDFLVETFNEEYDNNLTKDEIITCYLEVRKNYDFGFFMQSAFSKLSETQPTKNKPPYVLH